MKKLITILLAALVLAYGGYVFAGAAKTQSWNASYETIPTDTDNISEGAQRIRNLKRDIRERFEEDHYFDLAGTQADQGEHKKVTFQAPLGSDPTNITNKGFVYTKDVSSIAELFWEDENGNVTQLTQSGAALAFPSGTKMPFFQNTCPAGWTILTTVNDGLAMITNGSGAGGQTGGTVVSGSTWTQPSHTHTGPSHRHTGPSHTHSLTVPKTGWSASGFDATGRVTGLGNPYYAAGDRVLTTGSGGTGYTGYEGTENTGSSATSSSWRPYSYNFIICTKN